jgi:hypothetical protein
VPTPGIVANRLASSFDRCQARSSPSISLSASALAIQSRVDCSGDSIATYRIVGRLTASQIASASLASVFPRFTYGFT